MLGPLEILVLISIIAAFIYVFRRLVHWFSNLNRRG